MVADNAHSAFPHEGCLLIIEELLKTQKNIYMNMFNNLIIELAKRYKYLAQVSYMKDKYIKKYITIDTEIDNRIENVLEDANVSSDLIKFYLSPRPAVIFGMGHQAKITFSMCCIFGKRVVCFCVSSPNNITNSIFNIPCYTINELREHIEIQKCDIILALNERFYEEILQKFEKNITIYAPSSWEHDNIALEKAKNMLICK